MSPPQSNENGSHTAYPSTQRHDNQHADGLTKRELFAAMAMQSLIAKAPLQELAFSDPGVLPAMCANGALDYADALLTALEQVQK